MNVRVDLDDLAREPVRDLLQEHLHDSATTPQEREHALDLDDLESDDVQVFSAWDAGTLLGVAAVLHLEERHAELKAIRTTRAARGAGIGGVLLEHVVAQARAAGYERLSLETGTQQYFTAARAMYEGHGFEPTEPFGDYREDPRSVYLTREL